MLCVEPALKRKKEDIMDHSEEACASRESSQTSVKTEDSNVSIDPFEDCSPVAGETQVVESAGRNNLDCMAARDQPLPGTSKNDLLSPGGSSGVSPSPSPRHSPCKGGSHKEVQEEWMGSPIEDIQRGIDGYGYPQVEAIRPSSAHTVLFQVVNGKRVPPTPFPDVWDGEHVRMPFSPKSQYPVGDELKSRWEMVVSALLKHINNSEELEEAILSYNSKYSTRWDFGALHRFFSEEVQPEEATCFFKVLLPQMVNLALQLPELFTRPIPLLRQNRSHSISMSQMQAACLLANGFFCTFPRRNTLRQTSEYASFPEINFHRLFQVHKGKKSLQRTYEKLKCIFHYFRRVCHDPPQGALTFSRKYIAQGFTPVWSRSSHPLRKLHISRVGNIEDNGKGMLQVDFANKMIGGGVLGWGCVQEEIRFVICPELIVACLFTESLNAHEAVIIAGCEQFSQYEGYADDFTWTGDYHDRTPRDSSGRMLCTVVAIDALPMRNPSQQFTVSTMTREINKAFIGFSAPDIPFDVLSAVATGNWGCGVYRGNAHLKALLQLLAAAQSDRSVAYFTFGNVQLMKDVARMHKFLTERKATVGAVWRVLTQYYDECFHSGCFSMDLYEFIHKSLDPSYVPKLMEPLGRKKVSIPQSVMNKALTSHASPKKQPSASASSVSCTMSSTKFYMKDTTFTKETVWNKGQKRTQSTKEVKEKRSLIEMTHRQCDDASNLRKTRPASSQKRIFEYFKK